MSCDCFEGWKFPGISFYSTKEEPHFSCWTTAELLEWENEWVQTSCSEGQEEQGHRTGQEVSQNSKGAHLFYSLSNLIYMYQCLKIDRNDICRILWFFLWTCIYIYIHVMYVIWLNTRSRSVFIYLYFFLSGIWANDTGCRVRTSCWHVTGSVQYFCIYQHLPE